MPKKTKNNNSKKRFVIQKSKKRVLKPSKDEQPDRHGNVNRSYGIVSWGKFLT